MVAQATVDTSPSLVIRPFVFPKKEWEMLEDGNQVKAIPGSWTPKHKRHPSLWLALVSCPNCKNISILHKSIHAIDHLGKLTPSYACKYPGCTFHRGVYLDEWNKKPLYACAVIENNKIKHYYTHATSQGEARVQLGIGNYTEIVAIGRAIGFFVEDKQGLILSAD